MQQAHQAQIIHVLPWGHSTMGGKLLGNLLCIGQLDFCQVHTYLKILKEIHTNSVGFLLS